MMMLSFSCAVWAEPKPGVPIFEDNFDSSGTFAENWVAKGGKSQDGKLVLNGDSPKLRRELPPEFYVECDLILQHQDQAKLSGHAGMMIGPGRFAIMANGTSFLIAKDVDGATVTRYVPIDGYELGRPVHIAVARTIVGDLATYTYLINGKVIGSFCQSKPEKATDGLYFLRSNVDQLYVDNFRLSSVNKSADESLNRSVNSSFEYVQDGFPLYVTRSYYDANFSLGDQLDYNKYVASVCSDSTEKHSGKYSLKIAINEHALGYTLGFHGTATVTDRPGVMSIWMKSDRDDMKVQFDFGYGPNKSKIHTVGKEWKRYEVVQAKLPKPLMWPGASLLLRGDLNKDGGTLWIDDLQCEILENTPTEEELKSGRTFATPYRPSELDKEKFAPEQKEVRAPSLAVPALPSGVKPSSELDTWKSHAAALNKFYFTVKAPKNKTEAYLACDKDNLYIGYRNFGDELSLSQKATHGYGHGVECFFVPSGNGENFMQISANAAGAKTALGLGADPDWTCEWTCKAVENKKLGSVDYLLTIPMGNFAGSDLSTQWLLNLCRNDDVSKENISLVSFPRVVYKNTNLWPVASFPEEVIRANSIGVENAAIFSASGNRELCLDIRNLTGEKRKVNVRVTDVLNRKNVIGERQAVAEIGTTKVVFPVNTLSKKVEVTFRDQEGKLLFSRNIVPVETTVLSMLGRLSFYMNEPEAVFRARLNLPGAEKYQAVLECAGKQVRIPASSKFTVKLPLNDVKPGTYEAVLFILDGEKQVAKTTASFIKREFRDNATQINRFSRSVVVNGKPLFMFAPFVGGFYLSHVYTPDTVVKMLSLFQRYGFRSMHFLANSEKEASIESANAFLNAADAKSIPSIVWLSGYDMENPEFGKYVKRLGGKNIISYLLLDEPELSKPAEWTLAYMRKRKELFPYHPTQMNNTVLGIPNNYANLETDILMLDDYLTNSEKRTVYSVIAYSDLMWKIGEAEGKPCYYFLVGSNSPLHYREPSYGEQIASCYGAIASGCTGISLFFGFIQTPGNWKACLQIAQETTFLNDVLTSEEECADAAATGNPKYLRVHTKKHDGNLYIVTCNIDSNPAEKIVITLPTEYQYQGSVEVMFEDRKCEAQDGKFTDDFDKWSRHVYKIKLK